MTLTATWPLPGRRVSGEGGCGAGALSALSALQRSLCHVHLQGWRVTGEVVAVLEPSRRRESVVGED